MKTQIMIDLETLGTTPGSVILSIGAVSFGEGSIIDLFYERIDPQSCVALGMHMDVATVLWWMRQAEAPRLELTLPGKPVSTVLLQLSSWIADPEAEIWGNGAAFDNTLLASAYQLAGLPRPWKYCNDRCYRTLKNLFPLTDVTHFGIAHNALDDAATQATHLMRIFELIDCGVTN